MHLNKSHEGATARDVVGMMMAPCGAVGCGRIFSLKYNHRELTTCSLYQHLQQSVNQAAAASTNSTVTPDAAQAITMHNQLTRVGHSSMTDCVRSAVLECARLAPTCTEVGAAAATIRLK